MTLAIGVPQYGSKKKNNWRIGDGDNIYRILPPLGKLAATGGWAVFEALHWGYRGSKGMRPFKCIQKKHFKSGMITVQCPECDKIAEYKGLLESAEEQKASEGMSKDQIKEAVKPLSDWLFSHNLDKKWYVNAMKEDGSIGRLAMPHKMYQALQQKIEKLINEDGIDPIAVDGGVWFVLTRTGKGVQTAFSVDVQYTQETVNGRKAKVIKPAALNEETLAKVAAEAYDLSDSFRKLTYDEIKRLVDSGGDQDEVDHVFSSPDTDGGMEPEPEAGAVASAPKANALTKPKPVEKLTEQADIEAQVRAEVAARMAAKAGTSGVKKAEESQSDEDFIKQYMLKQ
jgi:hypothetical protein